jgi:hypothetical protein
VNVLIPIREGDYDDNRALVRLLKNPDSPQNAILPWTPPIRASQGTILRDAKAGKIAE